MAQDAAASQKGVGAQAASGLERGVQLGSSEIITSAVLAGLGLMMAFQCSGGEAQEPPAEVSQEAPAPQPAPRPPQVVSPEVGDAGTVTFRIYAPNATRAMLTSPDVQGIEQGGAPMVRSEEGIWETTLGPVEPGAYRYHFSLDGVNVVDPSNPKTSESNAHTWSLVYVSGSEYWDTRDVPHGAIAEVTYYSSSLQAFRRMHVYTPPGYEAGGGEYPVLYLLHGASDSDDSWSTVGRAGFILDNLIASGEAVPMVVVMPAGHTGPFSFGAPGGLPIADFTQDFIDDIRPYVESHYRLVGDRAHRAIAGLSMGGAQTLEIAFRSLRDFGYIGVFSSGIFEMGGGGPPAGPTWEDRNRTALDDAEAREGLRLLWFATGRDDFLLQVSRATVGMLEGHGFEVVYKETEGAHTWLNWRRYLVDFARQLFR